jgi:hypothetical protein
MAVPAFEPNGVLPPGVHACTLEEVRAHFGQFQKSDRRPKLFTRLNELVSELQRMRLCIAVVINGSFATAKAEPNDIDLLLLLPPLHDWDREPSPDEYNLLSRKRIRRRLGFDVFLVSEGSRVYDEIVEFFGRLRDNPGVRKGMLRIDL